MNLDKLRQKINMIDNLIIELIKRRAALMPAVGKYKKKHGLAINQPKREKEVIKQLQDLAKKRKLDPVVISKIFKILFAYSKNIQKKS
jgi:chorismate mutase